MGPGGTSRNYRQTGPLQVVHHRQVAGNHVDDGAGHKKRGYLAWAALLQDFRILFYLPYPADT